MNMYMTHYLEFTSLNLFIFLLYVLSIEMDNLFASAKKLSPSNLKKYRFFSIMIFFI